MLLRSLLVASVAIASSSPASSCDGIEAMHRNVLGGALAVQVRVNNASVCFRLSYNGDGADWISLGLSSSQYMVNNPPNNAVIYDAKKNNADVYVLGGYSNNHMERQTSPSSMTIRSSSAVNGELAVTYEHKFDAVSTNDVPIDLVNGNNILLWAYGKGFPSYHDDQGAQSIHITIPSDDDNAASNGSKAALQMSASLAAIPMATYQVVLGAIGFFGLLGLATARSSLSPLLRSSLLAPPAHRSSSIATSLHQALADLSVGQATLVGLYVMLIGITISVVLPTVRSLSGGRAASVIFGHLSTLHLAFLLLPSARGGHWGFLFGVTHTRLVTFHKWLGSLFLVSLLGHFVLNVATLDWSVLSSLQPFGAQKVLPAYGLYAGLVFVLMGLLALPFVRQRTFELFYFVHRLGSLLGIVFVCLHATAIWQALVAPLVLYLATLVAIRSRAFWQRFSAHVTATTSSTVLLELPSTKLSNAWHQQLGPCTYFYLCVPSVSRVEWHPFSAMTSPHTGHVAFCMKSRSPGSFTDRVLDLARKETTLDVLVGGPYGRPSVDLALYDRVLLFAGGIGITPMAHILNSTLQTHSSIECHLCWVVREPEALLSVAPVLFPLRVAADLFVSSATDDGHVKTVTGEMVGYAAGRPDVRDEMKRFEGRTCVLACGPESFVHDVQVAAHLYGFDFHKELFC
ncbi:hypothetical protein SDRG_08617 [Saprolegnia diclina VS20]|uniref:DOMON domain-containing protein n=1 Tax=Saprolegnia diclina (strain VS20) TaxID=1156394 RepID=T0QGS8_SAPDV|nr:hypothetical protein SDRG_08617 [Saprolegnia diclina VS20]EQC33936.1 hypothetical protein SDRG_08617 [Saprolegnia diclina VS20]|eukprot:XP_008612731.1 hypothetical protein SDRG_08617 [Saprolegnia diclina VS20]